MEITNCIKKNPLPSVLRRTAKDATFIIYCSCAPANATWIVCHCSSFRKFSIFSQWV